MRGGGRLTLLTALGGCVRSTLLHPCPHVSSTSPYLAPKLAPSLSHCSGTSAMRGDWRDVSCKERSEAPAAAPNAAAEAAATPRAAPAGGETSFRVRCRSSTPSATLARIASASSSAFPV